jgi:hypothetical protein
MALLLFLMGIWGWSFRGGGRPPIFQYHPNTLHSPLYTLGPTISPDLFDIPPVDSDAIKTVCSNTNWNNSVVFTCVHSFGGVGNVRNSILNCVRYAISAGAGLVLPELQIRDSKEIYMVSDTLAGMDYLFDTEHFIKSLALSCTGLKIYDTLQDAIKSHKGSHGSPSISLLPESLAGWIPSSGMQHPEQWGETFHDWLDDYLWPGTKGLKVIELERSFLNYPVYSDGTQFAHAFGNILKFRADARRLATQVLLNMSTNFPHHTSISDPIVKNAFLGAHLRTEEDAKMAWGPLSDQYTWQYATYDRQVPAYLAQAERENLSLVYVASGDSTEVSKFSADAAERGMKMVTKYDFLNEDEKRELADLVWDQHALVS